MFELCRISSVPFPRHADQYRPTVGAGQVVGLFYHPGVARSIDTRIGAAFADDLPDPLLQIALVSSVDPVGQSEATCQVQFLVDDIDADAKAKLRTIIAKTIGGIDASHVTITRVCSPSCGGSGSGERRLGRTGDPKRNCNAARFSLSRSRDPAGPDV